VLELLHLPTAVTASLQGPSVASPVLQAMLRFSDLTLLECWAYNKARGAKHMLIVLK